MWVYDKRRETSYWRDPVKDAEARERYNEKRRAGRERVQRKRDVLTVQQKRQMLPTLLDECDECGIQEGVKLQTPGRTLRQLVNDGFSWSNIVQAAKDNPILCPTCQKELKRVHTTTDS